MPHGKGEGRKQALFEKSAAKTFVYAGPWALAPTLPMTQHTEDFSTFLSKKVVLSSLLGVHRLKEISVRLGIFQLIQQEFHGVDRAHRVEDAAQHPHFRQHGRS